jgi:hypothetical protein
MIKGHKSARGQWVGHPCPKAFDLLLIEQTMNQADFRNYVFSFFAKCKMQKPGGLALSQRGLDRES